MKTPILEMKHIRKTFASTVALGDVDLNVFRGSKSEWNDFLDEVKQPG